MDWRTSRLEVAAAPWLSSRHEDRPHPGRTAVVASQADASVVPLVGAIQPECDGAELSCVSTQERHQQEASVDQPSQPTVCQESIGEAVVEELMVDSVQRSKERVPLEEARPAAVARLVVPFVRWALPVVVSHVKASSYRHAARRGAGHRARVG
jgi:hypothetical protein